VYFNICIARGLKAKIHKNAPDSSGHLNDSYCDCDGDMAVRSYEFTSPWSVGEHEEMEEVKKSGNRRTSQRRGSQSDMENQEAEEDKPA